VQDIGNQRGRRQGDGIGGHDFRDRRVEGQALGHRAGGDVARGQDALHHAVLGGDDAGDVDFPHLARGLDQRRGGQAGQGIARHQLAQRDRRDVLPPRAGGARAVEEPQHARMFGHQRVEGRRGDAQKLAVFGGLRGDHGDAVLHQPALAEGVPGPENGQDRAIGIGDVDPARDDEKEMGLRVAHGIERLARRQRDAVDGPGQFRADVVGKDVVGMRAGERGSDIDGHGKSRM
jgi:hypothetical protein